VHTTLAPQPFPAREANRTKDSDRAIVELHDIHLAFDGKKVLQGVSFSVRPQERLVILGQSGSGKSTLLRLILGLLAPDSGSIHFDGVNISQLSRRRLNLMRRKVGMVFQYSALLSSLSVLDNLMLPLEELTDKSRDEIDRIIMEKLEWVDLSDACDKMPEELSGGMKKRVALARALVLEPKLILYDEPTAGLDPVIASVITELMISISEKQRAASIIVTHEMESAFKVATRMAMLYEGRIIADDTPDNIRRSEDPVVAQFIKGETGGPILKGKIHKS
jgi:phospholipid/cholesterol/gamma-HCH transport system ATP-binding protein